MLNAALTNRDVMELMTGFGRDGCIRSLACRISPRRSLLMAFETSDYYVVSMGATRAHGRSGCRNLIALNAGQR
jgi:hypothetical protein